VSENSPEAPVRSVVKETQGGYNPNSHAWTWYVGVALLTLTVGVFIYWLSHAPEVKPGEENNHAGSVARYAAAAVLLAWLGVVAVYYAWAIYFYNHNLGVSEREWKILYPEMYTRTEAELAFFEKRRQSLEARRQAGETLPGFMHSAPSDNPYARDSFGLPPGTLRGTLALTAMVMFVAVELINVFEKPSGKLEDHFTELITCFMMVLAFYFGTKGLEALKERETTRRLDKTLARRDEREEEEPSAAAVPEREVQRPAPVEAAEVSAAAAPEREEMTPPAETIAIPPGRRDNIQGLLGASVAEPTLEAGAVVIEGALTSSSPLAQRVLALTASFETGKGFPGCFGVATGDFDGMGLSYGALQWNLGMGTLQPLLSAMRANSEAAMRQALGAEAHRELCRMLDLGNKQQQVAWARGLQRTKRVNGRDQKILDEEWREALAQLGVTPEMIALQTQSSQDRFRIALGWCRDWKLTTERAVALMFDISVQNGKLEKGKVREQIEADVGRLPSGGDPLEREVATMEIIASRRAALADERWRADVLRRKLTVARGEGVVHGKPYHLLRDFAIGLRPFEGSAVERAPVKSPATSFSPHFAREELLVSAEALRLGLKNEPDDAAEANLARLCTGFLEKVREGFGPLRINSGYRAPLVNKAVGGSATSAHVFGRAADFIVLDKQRSLIDVVDWIAKSDLPFDQVIYEFGRWVHLGIAAEGKSPRRQALMIKEPGRYLKFDPEEARKLFG
jgi:hypothetical protein